MNGFQTHGHYVVYIFLLLLGLFTVLYGRHLVRKLIGINILQTSVILFFLYLGTKWGASVPVLEEGSHHVDPALYMNPLPHALMLTAIVVGISTTGVALALLLLIYKRYKTLEEDKILDRMQ